MSSCRLRSNGPAPSSAIPAPPAVLVVDEVGPLELRGGGVWPALRDVLWRPDGTILLVAREEILADLAAALAPAVPGVFDVRDPDVLARLEARLFGQSVTR